MATAGKGLPFIGKMNEYLDRVLHPTVQKIGHSKAGLDVIPRGYYLLNSVPAVPYIVGAGSTDNLINLVAHGFKAGDVVRLVSTANAISEHEITIDTIVNVNSFTLAGYLSASLTIGDTFDCLRPVVERLASDGSSLSTVISPPVQYNRKSGGITVATTVLEDLDTPANSRAMPVVLHGVDAASISITSGDLNIASSHTNDSMRLGDGTTLAGVTLANELKVRDADLITQAALLATAARQDLLLAELQLKADLTETQPVSAVSLPLPTGAATQTTLAALLTELQLKADLLETQPVSIAGTVAVSGPLTDTQLRATPVPVSGTVTANLGTIAGVATSAKQDAEAVLIGAVNEAAPASDTASSGMNGRLQRIAQNISSLILQLPATLGIKTAAASLSVAPASDAIFNTKPKAVTGSYAENLTLTTVATFTAPANAIGAIVQADDANAASFRAKQGAAATSTSGIQFQAGRSEEFKSGTDISVCSEGASVKVYVQWFIQA